VQAFDSVRVHDLLRSYADTNATKMLVRILEGPLTYVGSVAISIDIPIRQSSVSRRTVAAVLSVPLPLPSLETTSHGPLVVENLSAVSGTREVRIHQQESQGRLRLILDGRDLRRSKSVRIDMTTSSILNLAGGDGPFRTWRLGIECEIPLATRIIATLEHSPELSLRCRIDNSEYHSLAQSAGVSFVRKVGFYANSNVSLKYLFGAHASSSFRAVAFPTFAASLGLLAGGYTLALLAAGHGDLAAVSLALTATPPVLQAIKPTGGFYRSADIHVRGPSFWIYSVSVTTYLAGVFFVLVAITDRPDLSRTVEAVSYALGAAIGVLGLCIVAATQQQMIPPHYCDTCARRIVWRRKSRLHLTTRRTVCRPCFEQIRSGSTS
jgi:hypothetical protein